MQRIPIRLIGAVIFAAALFTLLMASVASAAPRQATLAQETEQANGGSAGQEYVVKPGDWLSRISQTYLGSSAAYTQIIAATNAKAASDPRFTRIDNPDVIEVGQVLWIPTPASVMTGTPEVTGTTTATVPVTVPVTAGVRFVAPVDGATVAPTFTVQMAAEGLTIEPAGEIHENAGHFHIMVDSDFVAPGELIPFDESHLHFGKGQLTTTLTLTPGVHVLRLQLANGAHLALDGTQYRDAITVTVSNEAAAQPQVRFVTPADGAIVNSPVTVEMAAEGLTVEPAGEIHDNAGHFHILIDTDFVPAGELIPFDDSHRHFGQGQLTTTLELEPGVHVLRLQFANGAHLALDGAQYRDTITVTVPVLPTSRVQG